MEENLITSFSGLINERRQRALGIDQYIWRCRDDDKVRHVHAEHDDKVFDWDNPPETGHPGQAYNCRCFAEPYLLDEPKCEPDFVAAQVAHGRGVDAGVWEAIKDTLADIWQTLSEIPENLAWVTRLGVLSARERFGTLSEEEQAELDEMRQAVEDRIEEIKAFWRDFPETAKAFAEYAYAVETRPGLVMGEFAQCRATLAQVEDAARERAYLNTLIALNVAPAGLAAKLLRRRGRRGDTNDPDRLRDELLARPKTPVVCHPIPTGTQSTTPASAGAGRSRSRADHGKITLSDWEVWENVHLTTSRPSISGTAMQVLRPAQRRWTHVRRDMWTGLAVSMVH